jgi:cell division protein FtsL
MKLLMVLWLLALLAVWEKVDVYRTGYMIEQLRVQWAQTLHKQQALELELAKATAPEQVEHLATTKLGMVRPRYDQVVLIGPTPRPSNPSAAGALPVVHTTVP